MTALGSPESRRALTVTAAQYDRYREAHAATRIV